MNKSKVDLVLGAELMKAIRLLSIEKEDAKIQDTIRDLLLSDQRVIDVAHYYSVDLTLNSVARGGYRERKLNDR